MLNKLKIIFFVIILLHSINSDAAIITLYSTNDTKLNPSSTTTNYDTESSTGSGGSDNTAILFKFDIGSTGISATDVVSADLRVFGESRGFQHDMIVYRVLRNWVSNQATWNIYSTGNNWGTSGATNSSSDYTTSHSATGSVPDNDYMTIDVTDIVKDMITSGNYYGVIMRPSAGSTYQTWRTSEYSGTNYDPRLTIRTSTAGVPTEWYLRNDGGTCTGDASTECDGNANAAYPGGGLTNQACACNDPTQVASLMAGEDHLTIKAGDIFTINGTAPNFPAGSTPDLVTQIHGEGWDTGCSNPPIFKGTNAGTIVYGNSNTEFNCLYIKDDNGCLVTRPAGASGRIDNNGSQDFIACGDGNTGSANIGMDISGSSDIYIINTTIEGAANEGVRAYNMGNVTTFNFNIIGSGYVGWSGGDPPQSDYTGTVNFIHSSIKYTGCGWRAKATSGGAAAGTPHNCYSQDQSGYGDGIGANVKLHNWNVIDSEGSYNVSDFLDFLYDATASQYANRLRCEGNAGACFKSGSPNVDIENSQLLGNCTNWAESSWVYGNINAPGRSGSNCNNDGTCNANENFTNCLCQADNDGVYRCGPSSVDHPGNGDCIPFNVCRPAQQTTISLKCYAGGHWRILNSTISGNGDTLVYIRAETGCTSSDVVYQRNNIFVGGTEYNGGESDVVDAYYSDNTGGGSEPTLDEDYNFYCATKTYTTDPVGSHSSGQSSCSGVFSGTLNDFTPGYFTGTNYFDEHYLHASSPALNMADETITLLDGSTDVNNSSRGPAWDLGSLDSGSTPVSCSSDGQVCISDYECCSQSCDAGSCSSGGSSSGVGSISTGSGLIQNGVGRINF